ncbi:extracellular solute-binding protein [Winogradskya humida]|uniref:ABC transporter substrate-binding protein n=1 Tax=Winogradskya humida TaxID=113566 RepID=A0ABQ3ZYW2_9ACTN|nr:extracellular solute-binding protein [Actinoplanes humidus]GIE23777.1 ABC transporter substrate-binding protein [Actinoplanes humidus]
MTTLRRLRCGASVLLLLGALAAVAGCEADPPGCGADGTGRITFATVKNYSAAQRRDLTQRWAKSHPGEPLTIVVLPATSDQQRVQLATTLQADKRAGRAGPGSYDVVGMDVVNLPEFAEGGYLQPQDEKRFRRTTFLGVPWQSSVQGGTLYAVPFTTNVGLLYYWADELVSRKVIGNENERWQPESWQQIADVARASMGDDRAGYTAQLKSYEGLTVNAMELIWAAGGDLPTPTRPVSQDQLDAAADGIEVLIDGVHQRWISQDSLDYDESSSLNAFLGRKAVIMRHWPDAWPVLRKADPHIRVTMLPGNHSTTLGGENIAVARCSPHRHSASDFLAFLTAPEQQKWIFDAGVYLPTVQSLYTDGSLTGGTLNLEPDFIALLRSSIDNARRRPVLPAYSDASQLIQTHIHAALQTPAGEGKPPVDVINDLAGDLRG